MESLMLQIECAPSAHPLYSVVKMCWDIALSLLVAPGTSDWLGKHEANLNDTPRTLGDIISLVTVRRLDESKPR